MHDESLAGLIRKIHNLLRELERRELEFVGLGPGQARILKELFHDPGLTADDLRRHFGLDRSTVSVALRKLVARGYLDAAPHPADRRQQCHDLTRWGRLLTKQAFDIAGDHDKRLTHGIEGDDRTRLRRHLIDMVSNLTHELRHPGRPRVIFPADPITFPGPSEGPAP